MKVCCSIEDKLIVWTYERLTVLGVLGTLERSIDSLQYLHNDNSIEFGLVKLESNRDFLGAFSFDPIVDITLVKSKGESSIVTYSLDDTGSRAILGLIMQRSGFHPITPDQGFIDTIGREISLVETSTYITTQFISNMVMRYM